MGVVLMPKRKVLTADQWRVGFQEIIAEATNQFGRAPCMSLEEDEDGGSGAAIVASITRGKTVKKLFDSRGTLTNRGFDAIQAPIYKNEISIVLKLLLDYQWPETDFDANLDYWSEWLPQEDTARVRDQTDLPRWG
jgi:hypothetical protein